MEEIVEFNYNYIICGDRGFYEIAYYDIIKLSNVQYYASPIDSLPNSLFKVIARLNYSRKVNRYIKHPFDRIISPFLYTPKFKSDKPICYIIFFQSLQMLSSSFFINLKKSNPKAKFVVYFQDIIASRRNFKLESVLTFADLLISYDKEDADKFNMQYYPTPFSKYEVADDCNLSHSDVYFLGYAKNRYKKVLGAYEKCREHGLKCDFNLIGVPKKEQIYTNDISYDKRLSYYENLQHVIKTNCILEIMQDGATGYTPRLWEAIMYDKHLLTNNTIRDLKFKNKNIHIFDTSEYDFNEITCWINNSVSIDKTIKQSLSPIHFLSFIESLI